MEAGEEDREPLVQGVGHAGLAVLLQVRPGRRVLGCVSSTSRFTKQHPFVSHVSVKILHARASPWHQSFLLLQLPAHERVFDPVRLPVVGDEPAVADDAVHHCLGHVVVGKDLAPSGELDVGGEDERDPLVC